LKFKEVKSVSSENHSTSPAVEQMILEMFKAQQTQQRWWRIRFIVSMLLITFISLSFFIKPTRLFRPQPAVKINSPMHPHIGLIRVMGGIYEGYLFSSRNSADQIIRSLRLAYSNPNLTAIILRINSPGGSGVQAAQVYEEIQYLRKTHPKIPVLAVCDDVCASAAYWVAVGCNQIYANPVSLVGSIGTISEGMGYVKQLDKGGIERRLFKAGKNKDFLDPYSPLNPEHVRIMEGILSDGHKEFIKAVKLGRGSRLKHLDKNADMLFSGQIWTGRQALGLGLIDGLGSIHTVTRDVLKMANIVDYTIQPHFLHQLTSVINTTTGFLLQHQSSSGLNTYLA
jgi:protease-4